MRDLSRNDTLRLLRFVCSFAWTDFVVTQEERDLVNRIVAVSDLTAADKAAVQGWLKVPPSPEEVDPTEIPIRHRQVFLEAVRAVVVADKHVSAEERDSLRLFEELVETAT